MIKSMARIRCSGGNWVHLADHQPTSGRVLGFVSKFRSTFGNSISNPLSQDLMSLGQSVFLADRCFRRPRAVGQRTRTIEVEVPVSNKDLWSSLATHVGDIVSFASQDRWWVEFVSVKRQGQKAADRQMSFSISSINLFSEGLDSLCGAAAAITRGETPVLVSHNPPGLSTAKARGKALLEKLGNGSKEVHCVNIIFRANQNTQEGKKSLFPERSRLSRPFLYLCMAGAVAIELQIPRINLNENGFLSLNLPISASRTGTDVTRHAHPKLLRGFRDLLSSVIPGVKWQVENPLADMTKGEEVLHLASAAHLALETTTCPVARQQMSTYIGKMRKVGYRLTPPPQECGICTACIVRRAALLAGGVKESATHYAFNRPDDLDKKKHLAVSGLFDGVRSDYEDLLLFARSIREMTSTEFVVEFLPELSLSAEGSSFSVEARRIWKLYRRSADELLQYYGEGRV